MLFQKIRLIVICNLLFAQSNLLQGNMYATTSTNIYDDPHEQSKYQDFKARGGKYNKLNDCTKYNGSKQEQCYKNNAQLMSETGKDNLTKTMRYTSFALKLLTSLFWGITDMISMSGNMPCKSATKKNNLSYICFVRFYFIRSILLQLL